MTSPLPDLLAPGLRAVIVGTIRARRPGVTGWYAGRGNHFWMLLHESGLLGASGGPLDPEHADLLPARGVGLTDLVGERVERAGAEPEQVWYLSDFDAKIVRHRPRAVAFVSKTAAARYARAAGLRAPIGYGATVWDVAGVAPGFVLPGPSGANNGMPLPLRIALWRDLTDFLETL